MGELHLEIIVDRLVREFKIEAYVGRPQVAYRETIARQADAEGKYIRQTGGRGAYGHVSLHVGPAEGKGIIFEDATVGGTVPPEFVPAVERGVRETLARGVMAGYPMIDVAVKLTGGSYHEIDSSEKAFQIAGSMGAQAAAREAGPVLLEPLMQVEVLTPDRVHGRGDGKPVGAARPRVGDGGARVGAGDHGRGAARQHVWLFDGCSVDDPGTRYIHDAIFAVCTCPDARDRIDRRAHAGRLLKVQRVERQERGQPTWPKKNSYGTSRT